MRPDRLNLPLPTTSLPPVVLRLFVAILVMTSTIFTVAASPRTRARVKQSSLEKLQDAHIVYKMRASNDVVVFLLGSTPVKNWQMKAHGLSGEAQMVVTGSHQLVGIDNLTFRLPVRNLKGDVEAMDNDCYSALKADRFREITFALQSAKVETDGMHQTEQLYLVQALGTLSVAGVTRSVTLTMHSKLASDGSVIFEGAQHIKMSDYNVERPSLLFGAIKADDEMTLRYRLIFSQ